MPSAYSTNLRFEQQFTGENINLWGDKLNYTLARVDDAIAGYVAVAITGNYTLQSANTNVSADEARRALVKFTGTLAANATITLPNASKLYSIWNATTKELTFTTGSGTTVAVDTGDKVLIWCDGTNVVTPGYGGLSVKDYIAAAVLGATGSLPATTGNAGKFLYTNGSSSYWKQVNTTDLGDYLTEIIQAQINNAAAMAIVLGRRR